MTTEKPITTPEERRGAFFKAIAPKPATPFTIASPPDPEPLSLPPGPYYRHPGTVMRCGETFAPEGWTCTREKGHEGPCAAVQLRATHNVESAGSFEADTARLREFQAAPDDPYKAAVHAFLLPMAADALQALLDLATLTHGEDLTVAIAGEWLTISKGGARG